MRGALLASRAHVSAASSGLAAGAQLAEAGLWHRDRHIHGGRRGPGPSGMCPQHPPAPLLSLLLGKRVGALRRMLQSLALCSLLGAKGTLLCRGGGAAEPCAPWRWESRSPRAGLHPAGAVPAALRGAGAAQRGCWCGGRLCRCRSWGQAKLAPFPNPSWEWGREMVRPCVRGDVCRGENIPLAQKIAAESGLK